MSMYLYGNTEIPHKGDGALFHYTKYCSFLKILEDLTLKPSSFGDLNDMNEGNVHNMDLNKNFIVMYEAQNYIKSKCHVLCFSQNYDINGYGHEGTNHPAMWAHYANNTDGVCIVIDKSAFVRENNDILSQHFYKFEDVEYRLFNTLKDNEINFPANTPQEFIINNWKSLFYLKHKDWENEDEHRLFIMDYDGKFSIDGCIKYIALGSKVFLDKIKIKEILDKVVDPTSVCYHKFIPHSFAMTGYSESGYRTMDIAFMIRSIIMQNIKNPLYREYAKWLGMDNGYNL